MLCAVCRRRRPSSRLALLGSSSSVLNRRPEGVETTAKFVPNEFLSSSATKASEKQRAKPAKDVIPLITSFYPEKKKSRPLSHRLWHQPHEDWASSSTTMIQQCDRIRITSICNCQHPHRQPMMSTTMRTGHLQQKNQPHQLRLWSSSSTFAPTRTDNEQAKPAILSLLEQLGEALRQQQYPTQAVNTISDTRNDENTNIKSLVEQFVAEYPRLLPIELLESEQQQRAETGMAYPRRAVLDFLARSCLYQDQALQQAVTEFHHCNNNQQQQAQTDRKNEDDDEQSSRTSSSSLLLQPNRQLDVASTPLVHHIFSSMLSRNATTGLPCLVELRQDLLDYKRSLLKSSKSGSNRQEENAAAKLQHCDAVLRQLLSTYCFVPGLLRLQRITYQDTPAATIEYIARREAVHPVSNLKDLQRRLGPLGRRVYALVHPCMPMSVSSAAENQQLQPLVVLHISLQSRDIPRSMHDIQYQSVSDNHAATVAAFYSISNLHPGLVGLGLGEALILQAVERIRKELPKVQIFCTLSPLPNFRPWLERQASRMVELGQNNDAAILHDVLMWNNSQLQALAQTLGCSNKHQALSRAIQALDKIDVTALSQADDTLLEQLQDVMVSAAAQYLCLARQQLDNDNRPLDPVASFHISNGARLEQIHYRANLTVKGWRDSYGVMCSYRYHALEEEEEDEEAKPDDCSSSSSHERHDAATTSRIPVSREVQALLDGENQKG